MYRKTWKHDGLEHVELDRGRPPSTRGTEPAGWAFASPTFLTS
jgi:hypothetical protein